MDGLLLIDKPKGWTSFDVVAKVRGIISAERRRQGILGRIKVGHTGTLDPLATGLLVLAVGSYTKRVPELTKKDKSYDAVMTLGATSTTDDVEGELTEVGSHQPSLKEIEGVLDSFVGSIDQIPPQFSAIKIGGVRSYNAARAGKTVKFEPRQVRIHSITDIKYDYPLVYFTSHVGSGTYIRSLARDVGEKLGTGAYLSDLRRTSVGDFNISNAITMEYLTTEIIENALLQTKSL